jgi:hypothetical protein
MHGPAVQARQERPTGRDLPEEAMSDLQFWLFLAVAIPILLLPAGIAAWKGRNLWPVIALSLVFWPGALGLALWTRRR